jgi:hypothetical protein
MRQQTTKKYMFFSGSGQIEITEVNDTSSSVRFRIYVKNAVLSAKAGYNYNVANVLNNTAKNI